MKTSETIRLYDRHVIANYTRTPIVFVRGQGSHIWDADGNRYLDLFPGWGVNLLGHCHPNVVAAVREQAGRLMHVANNFYTEPQGRLAEMLSTRGFGGKCFFCNSGAEANEAAFKIVRLARPGRYKIITFQNSFHGRTLAALSATAQPKYHKGLEPIVPGFVYARFNDVATVEHAIDAETCAVMVEPVQGEGGVNVASPDFLQGLRKICDREGLLLVFDEVQTGCGRLGEWFGYQVYGVTPDVMTLAKGLGGGAAIGAMMAKDEVAAALRPGTHASTFGGNPLACAAGIATIETIEREGLLHHIRAIAARTLAWLRGLKERQPAVRDVRGMGGMIGIELSRSGQPVVQRCIEKRVLINCTHDTVLRLLPALDITWELMEEGLRAIEEAIAETAE